MVLDPFLLILLLLVIAVVFVAMLFLPSIVEIVKPRDKGPRRILKIPLQKLAEHTLKPAVNPKPSQSSNVLRDIFAKSGVRTERADSGTLRIFNDIVIPAKSEISDNIIVDGSVTIGDSCILHRSLKSRGNMFVGHSVTVEGNLISKRDVDIQDNVVIYGSVHAGGAVKLGEKAAVWSSVVASGDVELYESSEVKKNIIAQGVIRVLRPPTVDFPKTVENID